MTIKATIFFKAKETHPDVQYISDWTPDKELSYSDTYFMDEGCFYGLDDMYSYIKRDLKLVAGGGYNYDHIKDVRFDIKEVA